MSRSYYAAYSFAASLLAQQGLSFKEDRVGPEHEPLPDLIRDHLRGRLGAKVIRELRARISSLYKARLDADYRPYQVVRAVDAADAERLATSFRKLIERELP